MYIFTLTLIFCVFVSYWQMFTTSKSVSNRPNKDSAVMGQGKLPGLSGHYWILLMLGWLSFTHATLRTVRSTVASAVTKTLSKFLCFRAAIPAMSFLISCSYTKEQWFTEVNRVTYVTLIHNNVHCQTPTPPGLCPNAPYLLKHAGNWTTETAGAQPAHPISATGFYPTAETVKAVGNKFFPQ